MKKILINSSYGGFGLSKLAQEMYCKAKNIEPGKWDPNLEFFDDFIVSTIPRDDTDLINVVETIGEESWNFYSRLKVVEIPDDVEWTICEYDGMEWVAEAHRTWS